MFHNCWYMIKTLKGPLWEQVLVIFRADISSDVNHVAEENRVDRYKLSMGH